MFKQTARIHLKFLSITAFAVFVFLFSSMAQAHRVNIFAWVDGDTVYTESKFGGGHKVKGGKVLVLDENGNQLLAGKTDDKGEFSFAIPKKSPLKIVLNATMGHRAEWYIPLSEISGEKTTPAVENVAADSAKKPEPLSKTAISTSEMEAIVEQVLDRKLKPINHMLAEMQQPGPSFRDIFGGIGYIFGLVGIGAWFRYRK